MLRLPLLMTLCALAIGCSESAQTGPTTPDAPATEGASEPGEPGEPGTDRPTPGVPATPATTRMVGEWGLDGEVFLIVSRADDRIVFSVPENDTWRMEIGDARVDGDSVAYVQKHSLHSGEYHPFNGVACNTIVRLIDADTMEMTMTTVDAPDIEAQLLVRIE